MSYEAITDEKYHCLYKYAHKIQPPARKLVGRAYELRKIKSAMARPELCNVMLLGEAGSGKGHPLDTVIPVADSRRLITFGEIKEGDDVFDENGQPVRVTGVFPQGKKRVYKVSFEDDTTVLCNDEHLWAVRSKKGHLDNDAYEVKSLRDLIDLGVSDKVSYYVPCNEAVVRPDFDFLVAPYAMGVMLTRGCVSGSIGGRGRVQDYVEIDTNDTELLDNAMRALTNGDDSIASHTSSMEFLRNVIMSMDLVGERNIPEEYLSGSVRQRYELLQGLMDSDGTMLGDKCCFITNSLKLCEGVRELAASLGLRTKMSISGKLDDVRYIQTYIVEFIVSDKEKCRLFTTDRRLSEVRVSMNGSVRRQFDMRITNIEDMGYSTEMVCIWVDSPTHLYQVGKAHVVTHNTMLVQSTMANDSERLYLEVDLAKMIANCETDVNQMAAKLKSLFDDAARYVQEEKQELVLFIDEFHQIVQLSDAAVEALKPLLADGGARGIRVIAATTPVEFRKHISPNQPLVERLQRVNLAQTDKETTIAILKGMAERYGVADQFYNDSLYEAIYEYTNRYIPANAQPRKSILILDSMIGWYRAEGRKLDKYLLADVIYESEGVNVAFKVDASKIKARLDKKVLSQQFATSVLEQRLQLCVADLNNKNRPMSSLLFSGASGSGKATTCDTMIPVYDENSCILFKQAGDIVPGDYVFDREGKPTKVLAVFPQGKRTVYRVHLQDERHLDVSDNHLWAVYVDNADEYVIRTTKEMFDTLGVQYAVPMNHVVHWSDKQREYIMSDGSHNDGNIQIARDHMLTEVFDKVGVRGIECLNTEEEMVCFYVDNEEHLYQAGEFIVTHNTEMAKQLAEILFDDDRSLLRMDMTEYANAESLERFRRELTARAWEHPHSIILLDEIEKACSPVTRLLLQVLDDGRLIDENNREVSFVNAYIIMTTNAGSEIYKTIAQYAVDDDGSGKAMKRYDKLIRNSISTTTGDNRFPPELLGRIDAIVPFQPLSEQTMKNIARMKLQQLRKTLLEKHGVKVAIQENVVRYLVEDTLDTDADSGGARTVVSKLESEVTTKIAKFINENPGVYNIRVKLNGTLAADDESKLLSDAYVEVVPLM